jgi:hypothetical protein
VAGVVGWDGGRWGGMGLGQGGWGEGGARDRIDSEQEKKRKWNGIVCWHSYLLDEQA